MGRKPTWRKQVSVISVTLVATSLGACGGDPDGGAAGTRDSRYCSALLSSLKGTTEFPLYAPDFTNMNEATYETIQSEIDEIGDLAPPAIRDEWSALRAGNVQIKSLLAAAGISLDELKRWDDGDLPRSKSRAVGRELFDVNPKLEAFGEKSGYDEASRALEQHAQTECGLNPNE